MSESVPAVAVSDFFDYDILALYLETYMYVCMYVHRSPNEI